MNMDQKEDSGSTKGRQEYIDVEATRQRNVIRM
jgi:hypothetical protein